MPRPIRQYPLPRQRGALLSRMLPLAVLAALGACGTDSDPLDPAGGDEAVAPAEHLLAQPAGEAVPSVEALAGTTQRIAFVTVRNGTTHPDVYKMDPQGNQVARLTNLPDLISGAAWSYDNTRILMPRRRLGADNVYHSDVWVINADGSNGHWARGAVPTDNVEDPSWSPDGSRIVVATSLNHTRYLGYIDLATGNRYQFNVVTGGTLGMQPSYNKTGTKIIYIGIDGKTVEQINADGSARKKLYSTTTLVRDPSFSPDGKKIVFARAIGTAYSSNQEIYVKTLATGSVQRLTNSLNSDLQPTWSPDGSKIAFVSRKQGGLPHIYTMNATDGSLARITPTSSEDFKPTWSH